jgi:hypothetical protein
MYAKFDAKINMQFIAKPFFMGKRQLALAAALIFIQKSSPCSVLRAALLREKVCLLNQHTTFI